jgi:hypothetical protein
VKRIIFKSENMGLENEIIKGFFDGVFNENIQKHKKEEEPVDLTCDEEIMATEITEAEPCESPRKKVFTFSKEFRKLEFSIYEQIIIALHKTWD